MYEDLLVITQSFVAFVWILLGPMIKETSAYSFSYFIVIFLMQCATRYYG